MWVPVYDKPLDDGSYTKNLIKSTVQIHEIHVIISYKRHRTNHYFNNLNNVLK